MITGHETDAADFTDAVTAATSADVYPQLRATRLRDALAGWRGQPLVEVADQPWAVPEVARLRQLHQSAVSARIGADLDLGRHTAVTAELEALTAAHPLDEDLRSLLMTALYRSGRQSDALGVYDDIRRVLDDELGITPSPRLRDLHVALLNHAVPDPPALGEDPTLAAVPHNLPVPVDSFLGRSGAVAQMRSLMAASRIVTLLGPGGIGKTRLALHSVRGLAEQSADASNRLAGVWFIDLAVTDAAAVDEAIAAVVPGAASTAHGAGPVRTALDRVIGALADTHVVLVLDNCEHVLDAAATATARLARACPNVRLLLTSREPLGVASETIWSVPSLPLPSPDDPTDTQRDAASVRLLVERAIARGAVLDLNADLDNLIAITTALDGVPLALELAAAVLPSLGPAGVAAHLDERFTVLTGSRALPARHRTLHATLDWSWDLLHTCQRTALTALSVFAGAFDLAAATTVIVAAEPGGVAAAHLAALVDKSLVTATASPV